MTRFRSNNELSSIVDGAFDASPENIAKSPQLASVVNESFDQALPETRRNPFGSFRAPDAIHDSAFERFFRGAKQSLVPLLPIPGEVGARLSEEAEFSAPAAGTAGFLGNVTGSIIPNALMLLVPGAQPMVAANFAGFGAGEFLEEAQGQGLSDSEIIAGAVGAGVIEGVTELVGTKIIAKIGVDVAKPIGRAILQKDFKQASKFTIRFLEDAGVEGGEEVTALVLENFNKVATGLITPEEALQNIKRDALITFAGGSIAGAALGVISLATPAARLEFRAALDERQNILQDIEKMSSSDKNDLFRSVNQILHQNQIQTDSKIESQTSPSVTPEQAENAEFVRSVLINEGVQEELPQASELAEQSIRDEPLGLRRPPQRDRSLEALSFNELNTERRSAIKELDQLEKQFDENPDLTQTDLEFKRKLIVAQDRFSAVETEDFRRDEIVGKDVDQLFKDFVKKVGDIPTDLSGLPSEANESLFQAKLILGEIVGQGNEPSQKVLDDLINSSDRDISEIAISDIKKAVKLGLLEPGPAFGQDEVKKLAQTPKDLSSASTPLKEDPLLNSVDSRPFETTISSVNEEIANTLRRRRVLPSGKLSKPPSDNVLKLIYGLEEGASLDTMAEFMGGGEDSVTWNTLFGEIKKGRDSSLDSYYTITDQWHEAIAQTGIQLGGSKMRAMSPALAGLNLFQTVRQREKVSKAITQSIQLSGGQTVKMHPSQLMFLAASLQDQQTRRLILSQSTPVIIEGQPSGSEFILTKDDVATIEQSLDPQQRAMVNSFVEIVNGPLRELYVQYSERQFGENRAREDTYVPRHRSSDQIKAVRPDSSQASQQIAMDRVGINKERTEDTTQPIEVRDLFLEFANLNWTINQLRFVSPTVQSARRVLAEPSVSRTVRESTRGSRALRRFTDHYDEIDAGVVGRTIQPRMSADSAFGKLARNVSKGVLGFSPTVPFYQPVSLINASFEMDTRFLMRAWLEQAHFNPAVDKRMKEVGAIRFRSEGSTYSLINEGAAIGQQPQALLGVNPKNELAFSAIRFFDGMAVRTIWRGAELQAESEFKRGIIPEDQQFERAKQIATNVINRTQPTSDPLYVSGLALQRRSRGGVAALLTMFRGQTSKTVDMIHREIVRMSISPTRRLRSAANIFVLTFVMGFILAVIREIIQSALRGFQEDTEQEDNLVQRLAVDTTRRAAGVAVLGEWVFAVTRPLVELTAEKAFDVDEVFGSGNIFDPDFSPVTGIMEQMVRKSNQLTNKIQNDAEAEEILDVALDIAANIAALHGVPILAPVREAKKAYKQVAKSSRP